MTSRSILENQISILVELGRIGWRVVNVNPLILSQELTNAVSFYVPKDYQIICNDVDLAVAGLAGDDL